jgi:glycosyltransferase involved in cell wall biosynthesis
VFACPNYAPRTCGVGDFSAHLAREFVARGHAVTIHSRAPAHTNPIAPEVAVVSHPDAGPLAVARGIWRGVAASPPTDLVIQYTPQMWESWRFGNPAVPWLATRAHLAGIRVSLIAHELYFGFWRPDLLLASGLQRIQLTALLKVCHRAFVTTETRAKGVAGLCRVFGLPLPSVVRVGANALPRVRGPMTGSARIGVFSTAAVGKRFDVILDAFARIARERPDAELVLIGDLGPRDRPGVRALMQAVEAHPASARIRMTGRLELDAVAREIGALDVYFCPMDTGANTRSSTLPSALGSGIPVVAIRGSETDVSLFRDRENVLFASALTGPALAAAALEVLRDSGLSARLSAGAVALYDRSLSWPKIADHVLAELERD